MQNQALELPQVLNMIPLRASLGLHWKRTFAKDEDPSSMFDAWASFKNDCRDDTSKHGSNSGYVYMGENLTAAIAQKLVDVGFDEDTDYKVGRGVARLGAKSAVVGALHPLSQAATYSIVCEDNIGVLEALRRMRRNGVPLWNGVGARVVVMLMATVTRDFAAAPVVVSLRNVTFGPAIKPADAKNLPFDRPTMFRRIKDAIGNIYASSFTNLAVQSLLYPLECVRMRMETQYFVKSSPRYASAIDCIKRVYRSEGWRGFYRGFHAWSLAVPLEVLWPLGAWTIATALVYVFFKEEADDDVDDVDELAIGPTK